jgi:hypothetical protein
MRGYVERFDGKGPPYQGVEILLIPDTPGVPDIPDTGGGVEVAIANFLMPFKNYEFAMHTLPVASHPNIARYIDAHMNRPSFKQWVNKDGFMTLE